MFKYTYTITEPIKELDNMSNYYSASNQTQAEGAIQLCQYIVGSVDQYGQFSISSMPAIHKVSQTAEAEAKRLANNNPGKTFVVMQLTSGFRAGGMLEF